MADHDIIDLEPHEYEIVGEPKEPPQIEGDGSVEAVASGLVIFTVLCFAAMLFFKNMQYDPYLQSDAYKQQFVKIEQTKAMIDEARQSAR
jgi:hypothetical protein